MDIDQAVQTASDFLDGYVRQNRSFTTTDSIDDYRLDFQLVERGLGTSLLRIFGIRSDENPDDPSPEVRALAVQCRDALVAAFPEIERFNLVIDFMH